jgi:hypothetical protein
VNGTHHVAAERHNNTQGELVASTRRGPCAVMGRGLAAALISHGGRGRGVGWGVVVGVGSGLAAGGGVGRSRPPRP